MVSYQPIQRRMNEGMSKPIRIQLSRAKGWRMPPNTVKVDRTTKWGNPFVVGKSGGAFTEKVADRRHAWRLYQGVAPGNEELVKAARAELRGKNLACWCPHHDPYEDVCHAAILLLIANSDGDAYEAVSPPVLRAKKAGAQS